MQALAAAAGGDAAAAAAEWQAACAPLWVAVAGVASAIANAPVSGLAACIKPAVEAADAWAAETGAGCHQCGSFAHRVGLAYQTSRGG